MRLSFIIREKNCGEVTKKAKKNGNNEKVQNELVIANPDLSWRPTVS